MRADDAPAHRVPRIAHPPAAGRGGARVRAARWLALAALGLFCSSRFGMSQPGPADTTTINSVAEDHAGTVWATGVDNKLYRWQHGRWVVARGAIPNGTVLQVAPGPNGGVVVVWSLGAAGDGFTWQRGSEVKVLGRVRIRPRPYLFFPRPVGSAQVIPTAEGSVLFTGQQPRIYRLGPSGKARLVYTLQPSQYLPHRVFMNQQGQPYLALRGTTDSAGRTWIWSGYPVRMVVGSAIMRGFLIYDRGHFAYHPQIPGLPSGQLSSVGRWDEHHLAAAVFGQGLYLINTTTLTARRLRSGHPRSFRFLQRVFRAGGRRYVVASVFHGPVAENRQHRLWGILWRYRRGRWQRVLTGLDELNDFDFQSLRPWLVTRQGLWLGAWGTGLWFVPRGRGLPKLINWQQGFPLDTVSRLFPLPGGRFLAVDLVRARTAQVSSASLLNPPPPDKGVSVINTATLLVPDRHDRLWGILTWRGRALDEWTGQRWVKHPLPGNIPPNWLSSLDLDQQGHVWLFPDCRMGPMAVFHPRTGHWDDYPSYQAALQINAEHPLRFLHPDEDRMKPIYGPRGQIVFVGACFGINYFDGRSWHLWNRSRLPGPPNALYDSSPFFDSADLLAINIHHETWEWQPERGWHSISYEPQTERVFVGFAARPTAPPPPGCSFTQSTSLAHDRLGRSWWTWRGNLYEGLPGRCRMALSSRRPQPFLDGRRLGNVLIDAQGNQFFETWLANGQLGEYVVRAHAGPLPQTTIRWTRVAPDAVRAQFATTASAPALFRWRLDGGPWSPPSARSELTLRSLSGGSHTLEAISIGPRLETDPIPAAATINIHVEPQQQTADLLARLQAATSDDQREAIVRALGQQPAAVALPALRAARAQASSEERWWIDAAIQEIEQRQKPSRPTPRSTASPAANQPR